MLHTNIPACVIKVWSNGGSFYIMSEIVATDNLNIANLMQTYQNFYLQNCSTDFLDTANKLPLGINKVCSNGGTNYIITKIIVKDNLNKNQI